MKQISQVTMSITMTVFEDGQPKIEVSGPLSNRSLCYGMLESAKDVVREYQTPIVQPVRLAS